MTTTTSREAGGAYFYLIPQVSKVVTSKCALRVMNIILMGSW